MLSTFVLIQQREIINFQIFKY